MKKILHVSYSMDTGGGPITIKRIIEDFPDYDHFVSGNKGVYLTFFEEILPARKILHLKGWNLILNLYLLVRFCKSNRIDILHLHGRGAASFGRMVRVFQPAIRIIYTPNGFFPKSLPWYLRGVFILGERILLSLTDIVFFVSESEKATFSKSLGVSINNPKLVFIQNYLNLEKSDYERTLPFVHKTTQPIKFLFIGRLSMQKGVDMLLEAIRLLSGKNFHVTVIGYGEMEGYLLSEIEKYDLSKVITYEGKVNEAFRLMPHFDALLLPSRFEGLPFTILEAMAYKLPVIATPCNGSIDLVKNGHGYVSKDISAISFSNVIDQFNDDFLKRKEIISSMVEKNYTRLLEEFSFQAVSEKITNLYN